MKSRYLCRQFLLSDQATIPFDGWQTCPIVSHFLHHHPELPVKQLRTHDTCLTLAGFFIDPEEPLSSDAAILETLFNHVQTETRLLEQTKRFAGRWVLVVETPTFSIAIHDACGLRRLFYSDNTCAEHFCASEASTAAKVFKLKLDRDASVGFLATSFAVEHKEYWWPGNATQFCGVRALLPNHYLNLRTREAIRYGLERAVDNLSLDDAAERGAMYLSNLIRGAAARFELALPITAGWDSRSILAACRSVAVQPHCYTLRFGAMTERSQDIRVPKQILARLNWTHHVIDCRERPTSQFASIYKSSTDPAHDEACQLAYALLREFPKERITLSGHCSEIARCSYGERPDREVTPELLAILSEMERTNFVLDHFDRWLEGARGAAQSSGIALLDLFYWEQRVANWAANGQNQWDVIHERFTPFSCRVLLFSLLGAEARFRCLPDFRLYRQLVKNLDSKVLADPVNPDFAPRHQRTIGSLARRIYSVVIKSPSVDPKLPTSSADSLPNQGRFAL